MAADEVMNSNGMQIFEKRKIAASYHDWKPLIWWQDSKHFFWHQLHLIWG
jgi:hypothetical protein